MFNSRCDYWLMLNSDKDYAKVEEVAFRNNLSCYRKMGVYGNDLKPEAYIVGSKKEINLFKDELAKLKLEKNS